MLACRASRAALTAVLSVCVLVACGGGGGGDGGAPAAGGNPGGGTPAPPPPTTVTLSGTVTYDRVPFGTTNNAGLDFSRATSAPVRGATVQVLNAAGSSVLATTVTAANGTYSVSVPANTDVFVRVRAELLRTGTPAWNVTVRDNTASDAVYVLDGAVANTGSAAGTRDLHARSGWTAGSGYTATRAAGPFSILDVAWQAMQLVLGADANASFPELRMFWSVNNTACVPSGAVCDGSSAAWSRGEIGTSFFTVRGGVRSIFVLGQANVDTDEFDRHVLAHEWGHYYQDAFSRDDSLGGSHSLTQQLDIRVAFSEGWGNAFAGMVEGDPRYRDSQGSSQALGFSFSVEDNNLANIPGWFNEASVQSLFWDIFDAVPDRNEDATLALGFAPIHQVMRGGLRTTPAFTTVHSLFAALKSARPADAAALDALAATQGINTTGNDFGSGETNTGGDGRNIPIFPAIANGQTRTVCSTAPTGLTNVASKYNKLGNRRFLRVDVPTSSTLTFRATKNVSLSGAASSDPDMILYLAGEQRARADADTTDSETLQAAGLAGATYVLEVYEWTNTNSPSPSRGPTCFDVQLTIS